MTDLSKTKVADLRKLAEEKGIEGWQDMKKPALLVALETSEKSKVDVPGPNANVPVEPKTLDSTGISSDKITYEGKAAKMKEALALQPKVRIKIPLEQGEKMGITKSVILNGYRLNIKKGVYVDVPEQVAEVLGESDKHLDVIENNPLKVDESNRELN